MKIRESELLLDSIALTGVFDPWSLPVLCSSVEIIEPLSPLVLLTVFPTSVPLVEHAIKPFALPPSLASMGLLFCIIALKNKFTMKK